jgi:hypothetical protein
MEKDMENESKYRKAKMAPKEENFVGKVVSYLQGCGSASIECGPDPDPTFHFNANPDPAQK